MADNPNHLRIRPTEVWINDKQLDLEPNGCQVVFAEFTRNKKEAPATYAVTLWKDDIGRLFIRNGFLGHQQILLNERKFPRWHEHELLAGDRFQVGDKLIVVKPGAAAGACPPSAWCRLGTKQFELPAGREVPVGIGRRDTVAYVKFDGNNFFVRDANDASCTIIQIGNRWLALAPLALYMVQSSDEIRLHHPKGRRLQFSRTGKFPDLSHPPVIDSFAPAPPDIINSASGEMPSWLDLELEVMQWLMRRCHTNRNILNQVKNIDWLSFCRCPRCANVFPFDRRHCERDNEEGVVLSFPLLQTALVSDPETPVSMGYRLRKPWLGDLTDGLHTVYYDARHLATEERFVLETVDYERNGEQLQAAYERMEQLNHPNIVRTIVHGRVPHPGSKYNWIHYRVIERIKAVNLRTLLRKAEFLRSDDVVQIMLQVCDALDYSHNMGVTHGNLCTSHIWLCLIAEQGFIAKITGYQYATVRSLYFPPETTNVSVVKSFCVSPDRRTIPARLLAKCHIESATIPESDVYQLGCVMYELVTGRLPFDGKHAIEGALNQVLGKRARKEESDEQIPERLRGVIDRCLQFQASDRFRSVAELKAALVECRE